LDVTKEGKGMVDREGVDEDLEFGRGQVRK
jgi:hypothetical protein